MDRSRLIMALALSLVVLMSWPLVMRYLAPQLIEEPSQIVEPQPQRATENPPQRTTENKPQPSVSTAKKAQSPAPVAALPQALAQTTQVGPREITIISKGETDPYWHAKLSNRGAVAISWILERFKEDGVERKIIGADGNELQLIPQQVPDVLSPPL